MTTEHLRAIMTFIDWAKHQHGTWALFWLASVILSLVQPGEHEEWFIAFAGTWFGYQLALWSSTHE